MVSNPIPFTLTTSHLLVQAVYGIRRENKKLMSGFFILSVLYLAISGTMFIVSNVRSQATPIILTPSCHVVEYLQADLRVLVLHLCFILIFMDVTRRDHHFGRRLHLQLREWVALLL